LTHFKNSAVKSCIFPREFGWSLVIGISSGPYACYWVWNTVTFTFTEYCTSSCSLSSSCCSSSNNSL